MDAIKHDDRRKHVRVGFTTDIQIVIESGGNEVILAGSSKDLSLKGLFVTTQQKFLAGTACAVEVYLSGGVEKITLKINATIVRETENGLGIVFDSMDVDTYSHLKKIVYYNSIDDSA